MNAPLHPPRILRIVTVLAGFVIILAGIKFSASIVGPLLGALFFAILFGMLMLWLEKKGVPHWLALTIAIISFIAILVGFFLLIVTSFFQLVVQIPQYQVQIDSAVTQVMSAAGIPVPSLSGIISYLSDSALSAFAGIVTSLVTVALTTIATIFLLIEANSFTIKINAMLKDRPDILEYFSSLGQKIIRYIVIRTEVNLVTGLGFGVVIAAVGMENAAFWGFLAFALSFIPYLGFWLAVIPPMLIAWSELGPMYAAIILIGAAFINFIAENILFPQAAGKGLKISPAVVFISLVFWGFVLGSIGALLAVPLTLALIMFLQFFEETRWIGDLLGPGISFKPDREPEKLEDEHSDPIPPA